MKTYKLKESLYLFYHNIYFEGAKYLSNNIYKDTVKLKKYFTTFTYFYCSFKQFISKQNSKIFFSFHKEDFSEYYKITIDKKYFSVCEKHFTKNNDYDNIDKELKHISNFVIEQFITQLEEEKLKEISKDFKFIQPK